MDWIRRFYNGTIAHVDLTRGSTHLSELPIGLVAEALGGAAVNAALLGRYREEDPLVLGTGPLTGSFAPASCLMVASFLGQDGAAHHVPCLLDSGPQLKFCGIDFLVITGHAPASLALHLTRSHMTLAPAADCDGLTLPQVAARLMRPGDTCPEAFLATGPAAISGARHATLSTGTWGGLDKVGLGAAFSRKNLKLLTLTGSGRLAFGEDNPALGLETARKVRALYGRRTRFGELVLERMGAGKTLRRTLHKAHRKAHACYHCPLPCRSYVAYRPPRGADGGRSRQGLGLLDYEGLSALEAACGEEALFFLGECQRLGVDPVGAATALRPGMSREKARAAILSPPETASREARPAIFSGVYARFGGGIPQIMHQEARDGLDMWEQRVALAMVLGVCPVFMLCLAPHLGHKELLRFITTDDEHLARLHAVLSSQMGALIRP